MSQPEPKPTDGEEQRRGWRRTLLVALLVGVLVLVGAGGAGFTAGRLATAGDGPVRCTSWDINRCIPGLDLDAALAALVERGFECEHRESSDELAGVAAEEYDTCILAQYRITFTSINGQVSGLAAVVPAQPETPLTPYQEAFVSWVAVLPFADQSASAQAASSWLSEQLASGIDGGTNIGGYDYSLRDSRPARGVFVLEVDAGRGGWLR